MKRRRRYVMLRSSRAPDLRVMRLFNPFMRALLRSPLHVVLSGQILLLTYTGRRSGRQYTLPVGYVQPARWRASGRARAPEATLRPAAVSSDM